MQRKLVLDTLQIGFSPKEPYAWLDEELGIYSLAGYYWPPEEGMPATVEIYPAHLRSRLDMFETLGHELDHVAWMLEEREWREDLSFWERPQEVRARKTEQACSEFLRSLQIPITRDEPVAEERNYA